MVVGGWGIVRHFIIDLLHKAGDQKSIRTYIPTSTLHEIGLVGLNIYLFGIKFAMIS